LKEIFVFLIFCSAVYAVDNSTGTKTYASLSAGKIDNFDNDCSHADASRQTDAAWWDNADTNFGSTYTYSVQQSTYCSSPSALEVEYKKDDIEGYGYFNAGELNKKYNVSDFTISKSSSFSCQIYSTNTVRILTKFRDINNKESGDIGIVKSSETHKWLKFIWQWSVDGSSVCGYTCDIHNIDHIEFLVEPGSTSVSGKFFLDNLFLEDCE